MYAMRSGRVIALEPFMLRIPSSIGENHLFDQVEGPVRFTWKIWTPLDPEEPRIWWIEDLVED